MTLARYRQIVVFGVVAIFFTSFADYSLRWGISPLLWIHFFAAISAPLLIDALFQWRLRITPLIIWCAGFLLVSIAWYVPSNQTDTAFQEVQTRFLSVIFTLLMLFLVARPKEQRLARVAIVFAVLVDVGLNVFELFNPLTFSDIPGRSSGLYANVNQSGAALMLGMILGQGVVPNRLRYPFVIATGVGILTTFSRAAMLGWILTVLFMAVRSGISLKELRKVLVFAVLVVGFVFSPFWSDLQSTLEERGVLTMNVLQRLDFFSQGSASDESANERRFAADLGWREFAERPLTGHGTGANRQDPPFELGTHNIYLALMVDHGILGLFILPLLLSAAFWQANRSTMDVSLPFALFVLLWGFFSHNVLEERYILQAVALAAAMVVSARRPVAVEEPVERPVAAVAGAPA